MKSTTIAEIKYNNNIEILDQFGTEIDLNKILVREFQGLPSDINNFA